MTLHAPFPLSAQSEPEFVPVLFDEERSSGTDSEDQSAAAAGGRRRRAVRFSRVKEVRQLSERDAGQALFARLSYRASVQLRRQALLRAARLPPAQVAWLALQFTVPVSGELTPPAPDTDSTGPRH